MPFRHGERNYIGVDIGSTSVKLVEIRAQGKTAELATYGIGEFAESSTPKDEDKKATAIAGIITKIAKQAKVKNNLALAAVPSHLVFTSVISLPKLSKSELALAIETEARKILPRPLEEMRLESKVLDRHSGEHNTRVLLTGAAKQVVEYYQKIFKQTKFTLLSLEPEVFALIRAMLGHDPAPVMIVDLGAVSTDIFVVDELVPYIHRTIATGGQSITDLVSKQTKLSIDEAEQLKRDFSSTSGTTEPRCFSEAMQPIIDEAKYAAEQFHERTGKSIEKIIVSGGAARLPGLINSLGAALRLRAYLGNPWTRVSFPLELSKSLEESAGQFAVAVGLAMREVMR